LLSPAAIDSLIADAAPVGIGEQDVRAAAGQPFQELDRAGGLTPGS
jgi:hypothetical protein